jgi:multiple sugar transport system substrate-binding protein
MRRSLKAAALGLVAVCTVSMLGACAATTSTSDKTIRVIAQAGGPGEALKAAAATYSASHDTKVQVELYDYDAVRERTLVSFSSGKNTYDAIGFDYAWMKQYIDSKYLLPIDDMAAKQSSLINMSDFVPAYVKWATVDGKQYALPWFGAVYMLYYRKDLLAQAGVSVPTTWEEYAAAAKTLQEKTGVTGTTFIGKRDDPLLDEYWTIAWSYGAQITTDGKTSAVNSPEAVKALTVWRKALPYAPKDALAADWPAAAAAFSEGKTAMMINFSDTSDALLAATSKVKDKVGFAAIPSGPTGKSTPNLGGWGLGISASSKHQQEAFDFIAWATSAEQQKAGLANGGSANRSSVLGDAELGSKYPYFSAALTNYKNSIYFPITVHWVDWEAAMSPPLSSALSDQISLEAGVKQSSDRLAAEIAKEGQG